MKETHLPDGLAKLFFRDHIRVINSAFNTRFSLAEMTEHFEVFNSMEDARRELGADIMEYESVEALHIAGKTVVCFDFTPDDYDEMSVPADEELIWTSPLEPAID